MRVWRKRDCIAPVAGGFLLAAAAVIGRYVRRDQSFNVLAAEVLIPIVLLGVVFSLAMIALFEFLVSDARRLSSIRAKVASFLALERWPRIEKLAASERFLFFAWTVILVAWLPCFLAVFPGLLVYDTPQQFLEGVILGVWNNHHPVAHTAYFSFLCNISWHLLQDYTAGVLVYTVSQMLILSYAFASLCDYLRKRRVPLLIVLGITACYAFLPGNHLMAVCMTKDVFFAAFFVLFMKNVCAMLLEPEVFFDGGRRPWQPLARLAFIIFLMCASRHQGIYISLAAMPFVLFALYKRGSRWALRCLLAFAVFLACWVIYTGPVFSVLGVKPGGVQEMLSVPLQGLSRVMTYHGETLTTDEKDQLESFIPDWQDYAPRISDRVKLTFDTDLFVEDPQAFFKLWLEVGRKNPQAYLDAFLINSDGYWNVFYINYNTPGIWNRYVEFDSTLPQDMETAGAYARRLRPGTVLTPRQEGQIQAFIDVTWRESALPGLHRLYQRIANDAVFMRVVFARPLMMPGFCLVWLVLIFCYAVYSKQYIFIALLIPALALFATLLLGPVSLYRYAYPLMSALPLFALMGVVER